jgi:hypothetical protein
MVWEEVFNSKMISPGLIAEKVKDHYRERKLVGNGFRELG